MLFPSAFSQTSPGGWKQLYQKITTFVVFPSSELSECRKSEETVCKKEICTRHDSINWFKVNKLVSPEGGGISHVATGCNSVEEAVVLIRSSSTGITFIFGNISPRNVVFFKNSKNLFIHPFLFTIS